MSVFFRSISVIFHPIFVPLLGFLLLYSFSGFSLYIPKDTLWFFILVIVQFTIFFPLSILYYLYWRKKITSIELSERSERPLPLLLNLFSVAINFIIFKYFNFSDIISNFFGVIVLVSALSFFISKLYKISLHMMGWGALTGVILAFSVETGQELHFVLSVILLVTGVVATSRLWLKEHNNQQIAIAWSSSTLLSFFTIIFI